MNPFYHLCGLVGVTLFCSHGDCFEPSSICLYLALIYPHVILCHSLCTIKILQQYSFISHLQSLCYFCHAFYLYRCYNTLPVTLLFFV